MHLVNLLFGTPRSADVPHLRLMATEALEALAWSVIKEGSNRPRSKMSINAYMQCHALQYIYNTIQVYIQAVAQGCDIVIVDQNLSLPGAEVKGTSLEVESGTVVK